MRDPEAIADVCLAVLPDAEPVPSILIAHPSGEVRERLLKLLRDAGYQVRGVSDGIDALKACSQQCPSAVLAPPGMPGLGGVQLAAVLLGREDADCTFVLLSSDALWTPFPA